jgi:ubiquinone/menaquinone biosynthesis C-methylase UbiE
MRKGPAPAATLGAEVAMTGFRPFAARHALWAAIALLALATVLAPPTGAEDEDAERRSILSLIGPGSGELIADVGCGKGTWTFPLARAVGPHGRIFAVDIDVEKVGIVRARVAREGVENIEVIHSVPDDPMLPKDRLDAVFLNDVIDYVDRSALAGFLAGIRSALKPAGRLVVRDPNGNPDRIIAECYRAGFTLVEAKVPLANATTRTFSNEWYALKFRRAESMQPAILPRLGRPPRFRTRLHLAEELFRLGLITREELRGLWERIENAPGDFDPEVDEHLDLIRAAEAIGVIASERADVLREKVRSRGG